jgi:transcriptional regulator with XRE-family HTH domain
MMISHYETGARSGPSLVTLQNLADALEVGIEWLLGRTDDSAPVSGPLAALFRSASRQSGDRLDVIKAMLESVTQESPKVDKKVK